MPRQQSICSQGCIVTPFCQDRLIRIDPTSHKVAFELEYCFYRLVLDILELWEYFVLHFI